MCIVCALINKEKITAAEGMKALWEVTIESEKTEAEMEHIQQLYAELERKNKEVKHD